MLAIDRGAGGSYRPGIRANDASTLHVLTQPVTREQRPPTRRHESGLPSGDGPITQAPQRLDGLQRRPAHHRGENGNNAGPEHESD